MKESPERLAQAKEVTEAYGGAFIGFYLTFGQYDGVYIAEYPDDEAATQAIITITGAGAVSPETLKAFTEEEYRDVVDGLQ
jgi:uncharacterized protein with GYD domain